VLARRLLLILQSAGFCRFCHHQARQRFDYTPMHQDDQGRFSPISKIVLVSERRRVVAVVVSIARGHDASYPFKTIGAAEGPAITSEREASSAAGCRALYAPERGAYSGVSGLL
jgi:hypothetical protein